MHSKRGLLAGLLSIFGLAMLAAGQAAAEPLGADFLLDPRPARIGLAFPDIATTSSYRVRFAGRNSTAAVVVVGAPIVGPILSGGPEALTQAATTLPPTVVDNNCRKVRAQQSCMFDVQLPPGLSPGSYSFAVTLPGRTEGQSVKTVNVDIRASAWLAGIVIAVGVLLGATVTDWRKTARPIVIKRIEAARLREEVLKLSKSTHQKVVAQRTSQLVQELKTLDADILAGADVTAKVADIQARLALLKRSDILLEGAALPKGVATGIFDALAADLTAALGAAEWKSEAITAKTDALSAELAGLQSLLEAAQRYEDEAAVLRPAVSYLGNAGETPDWKEALRLRQSAFVPIRAGGEGVKTEARAKALGEATDKLDTMMAPTITTLLDTLDAKIVEQLKATPSPQLEAKLKGLQKNLSALRKLPPTATTLDEAMRLARDTDSMTGVRKLETVAAKADSVPAILDAGSDLSFVLSAEALQPGAGATLAELINSRQAWDLITNAIALAGIASVGVLVLWQTNNTWGSVQDIILALLAGAGTRLSIGKIGETKS